jgi:hypothetical protein
VERLLCARDPEQHTVIPISGNCIELCACVGASQTVNNIWKTKFKSSIFGALFNNYLNYSRCSFHTLFVGSRNKHTKLGILTRTEDENSLAEMKLFANFGIIVVYYCDFNCCVIWLVFDSACLKEWLKFCEKNSSRTRTMKVCWQNVTKTFEIMYKLYNIWQSSLQTLKKCNVVYFLPAISFFVYSFLVCSLLFSSLSIQLQDLTSSYSCIKWNSLIFVLLATVFSTNY